MLIFAFPEVPQAEAFVAEALQRFDTEGRVYLDRDEFYRDFPEVFYVVNPPTAVIAQPSDKDKKVPLPEADRIEDEIIRLGEERGGRYLGT